MGAERRLAAGQRPAGAAIKWGLLIVEWGEVTNASLMSPFGIPHLPLFLNRSGGSLSRGYCGFVGVVRT
ncbi:hypothetical protein [Lacipirellula limnantheis]|uniref:Uncharacterized protein n=1 Tax=Lacipirellula limnantheis TaxID=2528024 RepID=A0A517U5N0_9BACT|nr:hypothetical protein [Lacipirellula limnantheis]QDT75870.1 hypothetical protein I41_51140 [Lacipirellula limnantheis]